MTDRRKPELFVSLWSVIEGSHAVSMYASVASRLHLDVMEQHYCGSDLFLDFQPEKLLADVPLMLDAHLMIGDPVTWIQACPYKHRLASVSVHLDSAAAVRECARMLKHDNIEVGIVVRLEDDWNTVCDLLPICDQVVVMGTPIGVKGVGLQERALENIRRLVVIRRETGGRFRILADGGIRKDTLENLVDAGADALAIGSLICAAPQPPHEFWDRFEPGQMS
ncbi:ribulose-phosphate 3-epimerase [Azospirillum agricola]|uniref:hypothetical protein n=1 Tax=Azospirillum agricola TaxID=1720247 RepID=UPI001AEAEFFF|nr:hypothetical protein [Azospirillum agricola]MBP2233425.1 ribulose-phosphate 3-epimerase [Azospirillum agricola]